MRIGERLEELDRQRQRAQDAKFLIQCWLEVSEKGNISTLEDVRRHGGGDGKVRCAHIARQLLKISNRLDPEGSQANGSRNVNGAKKRPSASQSRYPTREIIEKFLESLETDLLKQFDEFYRRQNFDGMRVITLAPHLIWWLMSWPRNVLSPSVISMMAGALWHYLSISISFSSIEVS